jgi:hypothetical protein
MAVRRTSRGAQVTLSPEAVAIAEQQAKRDRDTLARLVRAGTVKRDGPRSPLVVDIERRNRPTPDWTIIPKRKRRKRR